MSVIYLNCLSGFTKVLVTGGYDGESFVRTTEVIDLENPEADCKPLQDFPKYINFASGALWRMNQPVVCGSFEMSNECYILENGLWNVGPAMQFGRFGHVMLTKANVPDEVIVSGGLSPDGDLNSQEILSRDGWKQFVALPEPMTFHCLVQINETTFAALGGVNSQGNSNKTWFLDVESGVWTEGAQFPLGRRGMSCITVQNKNGGLSLLAIGGIEYENVVASVLVLDLDDTAKGWYAGPQLPLPLFSSEVVADLDGGAVLIGGYTGNEVVNSIFKLNDVESGWVKLSQELSHKRTSPVAISVPSTLVDCNQ